MSSPTTSSPRASSKAVTWLPMNPAAPVNRMRALKLSTPSSPLVPLHRGAVRTASGRRKLESLITLRRSADCVRSHEARPGDRGRAGRVVLLPAGRAKRLGMLRSWGKLPNDDRCGGRLPPTRYWSAGEPMSGSCFARETAKGESGEVRLASGRGIPASGSRQPPPRAVISRVRRLERRVHISPHMGKIP